MRDLTILVADDESSVRRFLEAVIRRENLPVANFIEAGNGIAAEELARQHRPDLTFLDIRMPGQDGLATAERLISEGLGGKVVIVSAYSEFDYAQKAMRAGVSDYLLKPVKPADFAQIVRDTAARGMREASSPALGTLPEPPQPILVQNVLAYIQEHISTPLRLKDIALAVHVSPWHLSRTFKRLTGKSLADSIQEQRINRAKDILVSTDCTITEVAGMVGFDNAGYFATSFKKLTAASPTQYRKASRQRA